MSQKETTQETDSGSGAPPRLHEKALACGVLGAIVDR